MNMPSSAALSWLNPVLSTPKLVPRVGIAWGSLALASVLGVPNLGLLENRLVAQDATPLTDVLGTWFGRNDAVQDIASECVCEARSQFAFRAGEELVVGICIGLLLGPVLEIVHLFRLRWRRMLGRLVRQLQVRPPSVP